MDPDSTAEFHEALTGLVRAARENGVDVEGGWDCRIDGTTPDFAVEIFPVVKPAADEDPDVSGSTEPD
ncbi:hypothetical protein ACFO0N_08960 [Halobium salinum]|uniref:Amphi-Trp domain-containing protein n=1 Tax=Halobium salinum TaxID=1364940 RepID=A0ABD5PBP7_9EURY|nr:hypothetical protein [Halobium salinum]